MPRPFTRAKRKTFHLGADRWDTVYNPVSYSRGLSSFWTEEKLDWIGRERASKFVAAQVRWLVFSGQFLDTLETDNVCAIRAATHHGHTNARTQLGLYLYDDFEFYRGLTGGIIDWSAATWQDPAPLFPLGTGPYRSLTIETPILRWALGIRPASKWFEYQVEPQPKRQGFQLLAWNRMASANPVIHLTGQDVGLSSTAEIAQVELHSAAYRVPIEIQCGRSGAGALVQVSRPVHVHIALRALWPDWPAGAKGVIQHRDAGGVLQPVNGATVSPDGVCDWEAEPGEYEVH
jgi:hypothetical protein